MSDINPTLDRLARGAGGGMHLFQHHDRAAHHHEKAAEQHRLAAEAQRAGDTSGAASYATQAWGHGAHAQDYANESLKGYAATEADAEVGGSPVSSGRVPGATTSDEPPLGYTTENVASGLNPNAANTPGIR